MSYGIAGSMSPNNSLAKMKLGADGDTAVAADAADAVPCTREPAACMGTGAKPQAVHPELAGHATVPAGEDLSAGGCLGLLAMEWRRVLTAAALFPPWADRNTRHVVPGMVYFPAVGLVVGAWVWLWLEALAAALPRPLASSAAAMMGTWLTGCRLEDGLASTVDALAGGRGKKETLRIMRDSPLGVYSAVAVSLLLFAKFHALSCLPAASVGPSILAGHVLARWTVLPICYFVPYVAESKDESDEVVHGSSAACLGSNVLSKTRVAVASACAFAAAVCGLGLAKALAVIAGQVLLCVGSAWYALRVLDGVVGDYLGATVMVSEMLTYLIIIADWQKFMAGGWWRVLRLLVVLYPLSCSMAGAQALSKDRAAKSKQQDD